MILKISDQKAKRISIAGIVIGAGTTAASFYLIFTFREPFASLVAQNDDLRLAKLAGAFQYLAIAISGLGFLLVVTNACFFAYVTKKLKKHERGS